MSRCVKAAAVTMPNAESPQCTDEDVPMSRMRARCRLVPTPCRIGCQFSGSATSSCPLRSVKGTFPLPLVVPANQH